MMSVWDALSQSPEAQRRYRESPAFREFIDTLDSVMREAEDQNLWSEENKWFRQSLYRMVKEQIAARDQ